MVDSALKCLKQACMLIIKENPTGNYRPGARIAGQNPVIWALKEFRVEYIMGSFGLEISESTAQNECNLLCFHQF